MRSVRGALVALALCCATPLAAQRQRPAPGGASPAALLSGLLDQARTLGNDGRADTALRLLDGIARAHPEIPATVLAVTADVDRRRYRLIGQPAPAIEAPVWFNAPKGTRAMTPRGAVTVIEFTAHWCAPCQPTYALLDGLLDRFGDRVRVILVSELYGQFDGKPARPAIELAHDSAYFARVMRHRVPVAVSDQPPPPTVPGDYGTPNVRRYGVEPLPQLVIVDRKGIVRRIMVGGDERLGERLQSMVAGLLAER